MLKGRSYLKDFLKISSKEEFYNITIYGVEFNQ